MSNVFVDGIFTGTRGASIGRSNTISWRWPPRARSTTAAAKPDALTGATATGNRYEQARAHAGLAYAYAATGDLDQARTEGQLALTIYTELDLPDAETVRRELAALGALTATTS